MILTVTLNSALDRVLIMDEFQPGTTMRPHKTFECVGGKGFDVSAVLQTLNVENEALGLVAGLTGQQLVNILDSLGITHDLIWVDGETRIAHQVIETRPQRHSAIITAGLSATTAAYQQFLERYQTHLDNVAWVVAAGTIATGLPASAYRRLTELAHQAGASILVDSSGPPLLETFPVRPDILKMNEDEFVQSFDLDPHNLDELIADAPRIREREQLPALVLTCGAAGILACTSQAAYLASVPPQPVVSTAGAGDGVSAALAWRLSLGDDWPEALRWAAAISAAIVLTERTADCIWDDVEHLRPQATVRLAH